MHTFARWAAATYPFNADKNASHFSSPAYSKDSLDAWHLTDPNGAEAKSVYERLSKDLLDNAFLIELVTTYQQVSSSKAVHDIAWSKRGELDLSDTYLAD